MIVPLAIDYWFPANGTNVTNTVITIIRCLQGFSVEEQKVGCERTLQPIVVQYFILVLVVVVVLPLGSAQQVVVGLDHGRLR
jgi:ABC-type transporter Mla maintaining outer membrane lipid asymmetry permease subunit MlaE